MSNIQNRPSMYSDPATRWLMKQSKAALADMLTEVLRLASMRCDDPASEAHAIERFGSVVRARSTMKGLKRTLIEEKDNR